MLTIPPELCANLTVADVLALEALPEDASRALASLLGTLDDEIERAYGEGFDAGQQHQGDCDQAEISALMRQCEAYEQLVSKLQDKLVSLSTSPTRAHR